MTGTYIRNKLRWVVLIVLAVSATPLFAADYVITNEDAGTNSGLDNPMPVAAVGGNDGTTLGQQRRNALRYGVEQVLSRVASPVAVRISARMVDAPGQGLACSRNSATLGLGGPAQYVLNFSGAPQRNVFYPLALANALAGRRLADRNPQGERVEDASLVFNGQLDDGDSDCLQGLRWYYGLDGNAPDGQLSFVGTVIHEMIHGLGFQSTVALQDNAGARAGQFPAFNGVRHPDIFSTFVQDLSLAGQPRWDEINDNTRADSLDNGPDIVWASATTASQAAGYLTQGFNQGRVRLYAPSPVQSGSSISHWSTALRPAQIMGPFEAPETAGREGLGMATCVLEDIGWQLAGGVRCPNLDRVAASTRSRGQVVAPAPAGGDVSAQSDSGSGDSGGGGGCSLAPDSRFDPLWLVMLGLAGIVLFWRRRSDRSAD